uniref:Uncharacterized protein n=1 Tax=Vitrella brassicaformis TaxID=1169539 RepID=A0A7S1KIW8_9ALVE|mmetsp:Transcript_6627/g.16038  ORF Transcript_6627/g.16038 Transcript_6627/m.16038 type:complete len:113 (+) Transcript_6627:356-694(+)
MGRFCFIFFARNFLLRSVLMEPILPALPGPLPASVSLAGRRIGLSSHTVRGRGRDTDQPMEVVSRSTRVYDLSSGKSLPDFVEHAQRHNKSLRSEHTPAQTQTRTPAISHHQ